MGPARQRAREALEKLESGLALVKDVRNRVVAALPDGHKVLLRDKHVADEVLQRSPWFGGSSTSLR
jgi:hypothetical protein